MIGGALTGKYKFYQILEPHIAFNISSIEKWCNNLFTGLLLKLDCINDGLEDYELFDDDPFWNLPEDAFDISDHNREATDTNLCKSDTELPFCDLCKFAKVCRCSLKSDDKDSNKNLEENGPYLTMNIWLHDDFVLDLNIYWCEKSLDKNYDLYQIVIF